MFVTKQYLSSKQILNIAAYLGLAWLVLQFAVGMFNIVRTYFPYEYGHDFLATKSSVLLHSTFYLVSFYIHITTSFIALLFGLFQFAVPIIRKYPKLHKQSGRLYAYSLLLLACPSGLVLAFTANGGIWCKLAFTLQCIVWFTTTWYGVQAALKKQWLLHVKLFIVSYAVTLAAFSLRGESYLLSTYMHTEREATYLIVTWLSWVGNALVALLAIDLGLAKYLCRISLRRK